MVKSIETPFYPGGDTNIDENDGILNYKIINCVRL